MAVHKFTGNVATLPDYVLERNRQALAAGLTIERQDVCNDALTTWYRGTEAQWRASPFCRRTKPFTRSTMTTDFECFSPAAHYSVGSVRIGVQFRAESGDYRGSISRELLPDQIEDLGDGILRYDMPHRVRAVFGHARAVYVGPADALIARKIAPKRILHDDREWADNPRRPVWESAALPDGRYCFVPYTHDDEGDESSGREGTGRLAAGIDDNKGSLTTGSHAAGRWARMADLMLRTLEHEYSRFANGAGVFSVMPDALATIRELRGELVEAIRCADIRVTAPPKPAINLDKLSVARSDSEFGAFMAAAMQRRDGPSTTQLGC